MAERKTGISEVTTVKLSQLQGEGTCQLIDARPSGAYNGWPLEAGERGGHISGARSLPQRWTRYIDWIEVLEQKGLRPERPTVVYGWSAEEAEDLAGQLVELGFEEVMTYGRFRSEWLGDPERPVERLARYRQLVDADWLERARRGLPVPEPAQRDLVVCHAHFGHPEDYERGHVPGAVPLDTNWLESPETWDRRSPSELRRALCHLGIDHETTVVLYGRFSFPRHEDEWPGMDAGHLGAMRCAAIMLYAGVKDVRVLDGGMTGWEEADHEVERSATLPRPVRDFGVAIPAHPEYMIDTPQAKELLGSDHGVLVSVRSWPEFIGEVSGYHYISKRGRIPGAVFGDCGSDAYHMENYRNLDHTLREPDEIAAAWRASGITPDKHVAFYCGTGWRGSEAFMAAWLMGWPYISVYDGGWFAWSNDPSNPIATGEPD